MVETEEKDIQAKGQEAQEQEPTTKETQDKSSQAENPKQDDKYKKEISGLNKKNAELQKKLEELERAKMSDEEKKEADRKAAIAEQEAFKAETAKLKRERDVIAALSKAGLDFDTFGPRIVGDDAESIADDVATLQKLIDDEVSKRVTQELETKFAGNAPKGDSTGGTLSYEEQVKRAQEVASGRRRY